MKRLREETGENFPEKVTAFHEGGAGEHPPSGSLRNVAFASDYRIQSSQHPALARWLLPLGGRTGSNGRGLADAHHVDCTALLAGSRAHFLFNSLHALAHLVEHGSSEGVSFIEALGDSYRYVLTGIRYGGAVRVHIDDVPAELAEALLIPPISLTELLTNAVKHNVAFAGRPAGRPRPTARHCARCLECQPPSPDDGTRRQADV